MSDLFETRMAIESKAAELAARRLTDHHTELLRSIVAAANDPDITEADFVALDGRLHRQVAEASGNPLLLHVWDSISPQFEEYSLKVIGLPGRLQRAHADHCGLVDAIIDRDPALAAQRAHDHVAAVQAELHRSGHPAALTFHLARLGRPGGRRMGSRSDPIRDGHPGNSCGPYARNMMGSAIAHAVMANKCSAPLSIMASKGNPWGRRSDTTVPRPTSVAGRLPTVCVSAQACRRDRTRRPARPTSPIRSACGCR